MRFIDFILALLVFLNSLQSPLARAPVAKTVTMSFVGDCTLGSQKGESGQYTFNGYARSNPPEYFFEKVEPILAQDDFTVVNCETVLSDRDLPYADKGSDGAFYFLGPASNAEILSAGSVEIAGFSNNHMRDYGAAGVSDTVAALEDAGLTVARHQEPLYVEKNGLTIGILACRISYGGQQKELYSQLAEMTANSDFQIVYPHGGGEGTHVIDGWRRDAYHDLIDRGADLIVASHPHVLQPIERYNGGTIVFSVGNFCYGGAKHPENRTAIYRCTLTWTGDGVELTDSVIPCYVYTGSINNYQPCPVEESDPVYQKIVEYMYGQRDSVM